MPDYDDPAHDRINAHVFSLLRGNKRTSTVRGFGFIEAADDKDIFLHVSECGSYVPYTGQRVSYVMAPGRDGKLRAVQVRPA
jgi:cold shock CspA family protein